MTESRPFLARTNDGILTASAWVMSLLVLPGFLLDASELPKLCAMAVATALLVGVALARLLVAGEKPFPWWPLALPMLALLASSLASFFGTEAPAAGTHALLYMGALVMGGLMSASLVSRERFLRGLFACSAVIAVYAIGQFAGFEPFDWVSHFRPRVFATLGNPVFLGGFIAIIFPLAFARWLWARGEEEKDLLTLLLSALAGALYLTWTRGSWLAVGAATLVQLALLSSSPAGRGILRANRTWLLTLAVLGAIGGAILATPRVLGRAPVPVGDRIRDAFNTRGFSLRFRMVTSEVAMRCAADAPVLGTGIGSFSSRYPLMRLQTKSARASGGRYFASQEAYAHNEHLQFLAEQGVVGLGIWIWLLVAALRFAWRRHRAESPLPETAREAAAAPEPQETAAGQPTPEPPCAGGDGFPLGAIGVLAAFAVDSMFNFPLHIVPTGWLFFVVLGLLAVKSADIQLPSPAPAAPPAEAPDRRKLVLAAVLVVLAGLLPMKSIVHALRGDRFMSAGMREFNANNAEMAEMYFGKGSLALPLDRYLRFRWAVCLLRSGRFEWRGSAVDSAMLQARTSIRLGYQEENVYKTLSDIYGAKDAVPRAIEALEMAHAINPRREDIMNNLAYYIALRGTDLERAIAIAREAVTYAPKDPTYNDTLGYCLLRAGRPREAVRPLEIALKSVPANHPDPVAQMARREILEHLAAARAGKRL